jgi:uncharacterized PurR-regulated membrane protein YhhQ (DUF165 family)
MRGLTAVAFLLTIPAANWLIGNVGLACVPGGPCLVPVSPGVMAPSGVLVIGLALVLRDAVHEQLGARAAIACICAGAALSAAVAPPALVLASAAAFLLSELADLAVYSPLRRRTLAGAVLASSIAGAAVDSALFLALAFGSLDYFHGQMIGKAWAGALAWGFLAARGGERGRI